MPKKTPAIARRETNAATSELLTNQRYLNFNDFGHEGDLRIVFALFNRSEHIKALNNELASHLISGTAEQIKSGLDDELRNGDRRCSRRGVPLTPGHHLETVVGEKLHLYDDKMFGAANHDRAVSPPPPPEPPDSTTILHPPSVAPEMNSTVRRPTFACMQIPRFCSSRFFCIVVMVLNNPL